MQNLWSSTAAFGCFLVLNLAMPFAVLPTSAELTDPLVEQLSSTQIEELQNGETVITGEDGNYIARMVVSASVDEVWSVLTDYDNFTTFLPNVLSSQIVESDGNSYIVEQVSEQRVFLFNIQSRLLTENIETEKERIDFRLIEGDLDKLQGSWTIEPISNSLESGQDFTELLVTQTVQAQPTRGTPPEIFNDLFLNALADNLEAIRDEVTRRQSGN